MEIATGDFHMPKDSLSMNGQAAWSPEREIEIVANTPPGGGTDRSARALHKAITSNGLLDVAATVTNIAGDGGRAGWDQISARTGDTHVIGISSPNLATDVLTGLVKPDQQRHTPLAILYTEYMAFVARTDAALQTGADLVEALAGNPKGVTIALSTSRGNPNHIALAKLIKHAGADVNAPVLRVFDSARLAVTDVAEGQADVGVVTAASAVPEMEAGRLRALGISSPKRLQGVYASAPTWVEQNVDCEIGSWRGAAAPSGIGDAQVAFWQGVLSAAVTTAEWRSELERHFWTEMYKDGDEMKAYLDREYAEMRDILGELGLLAS